MKKLFAISIMLLLVVQLITPVSGGYQVNHGYISADLNYNSTLFGVDDNAVFGNSMHLCVLDDRKSIEIELHYDDNVYLGTLSGSADEQSKDSIVGYVGMYSGNLYSSALSGEENVIWTDVTTTFTDSEIYAIISVGVLSNDGMPDIAVFGELSDTLTSIVNTYSEQKIQENSNQEIDNYKASLTESETSITPLAAPLDTSISYRGEATYKMGDYDIFNVSLFHQRNMVNGNNGMVRAKLNTNSDGLLQYMRNVAGYNSVPLRGYALSVVPDEINLTLTGCHTDFYFVNNSVLPQSGTQTIPIIIPVYSQLLGYQIIILQLPLNWITLTEGKFVNGCTAGNNVATWKAHSNDWESNTFDGDYSTESGFGVSAQIAYHGLISESVLRSISVDANVVFIVYIQSTTATVPMMITTENLSRTTLMFIYPQTVD